jgi:poly(A) polymerase
LLIRYGIDEAGKRYERARIYTVDEHGISRQKIDKEALIITDRLQREGYHAYIVGGAVRDLLIGKTPKDFDITTDAQPKKVRRLFWNSRIIGRRFRLVHVHFKNSQIIEVSTFRSNEPGADNNDFGTLEEDVERRDFSINALYYDPKKEYVYDFVSAMKDIRSKRMRSLLPLDTTFQDDPVRMIRAVKYAAAGQFTIPFGLKKAIRKSANELSEISNSRMTEEVFKVLEGGSSAAVIRMADQYGLLPFMLPALLEEVNGNSGKKGFKDFLARLDGLDKKISREKGPVNRGQVIQLVFGPYLHLPGDESYEQLVKTAFRGLKGLLSPLTPPNADVEEAVKLLFDERGIVKEKKKKRRRRKRKKKVPSQEGTRLQEESVQAPASGAGSDISSEGSSDSAGS